MSVLFPQPQNGKHRSSVLTNGDWVPTESDFTFDGDVQPISSTSPEVVALNIGRQETMLVRVYADEKLLVSQQDVDGVSEPGTSALGDLVEYVGDWFELVAEANRSVSGILPHFGYIGALRRTPNIEPVP
jgi:hypothetical protein